jgi:hypothetical protein
MPDPVLGRPIEIYERIQPSAAALPPGKASVDFTSPTPGATVPRMTRLSGRAIGASAGSTVQLEILTNRWYTVGDFPLAIDGSFESKPVNFAGVGLQACNHAVRARLYDASGNPISVSVVFNIKRENAGCPAN